MESTRFEMRIPPDERERWEAAARADGRSLASWLRRLANAAARRSVTTEAVYDAPPEVLPCGRDPMAVVREQGAVLKRALDCKPLCDNCRRKGDGKTPLSACRECNG